MDLSWKKSFFQLATSAPHPPRGHSLLSVIHFDAPFISAHSNCLQNCHSFHRIVFAPHLINSFALHLQCTAHPFFIFEYWEGGSSNLNRISRGGRWSIWLNCHGYWYLTLSLSLSFSLSLSLALPWLFLFNCLLFGQVKSPHQREGNGVHLGIMLELQLSLSRIYLSHCICHCILHCHCLVRSSFLISEG